MFVQTGVRAALSRESFPQATKGSLNLEVSTVDEGANPENDPKVACPPRGCRQRQCTRFAMLTAALPCLAEMGDVTPDNAQNPSMSAIALISPVVACFEEFIVQCAKRETFLFRKITSVMQRGRCQPEWKGCPRLALNSESAATREVVGKPEAVGAV